MAGMRGALRGTGSGTLRSIALLAAARARARRRRVTAGVGEASGSGRERASRKPASTHGSRGRPRLPRALPPAGPSLPEGAATTATDPRPGRSPQPVGGEGAARGGRGCEGGRRRRSGPGSGLVATPAVLGLQQPAAFQVNPLQTFPEELRTTAPPLSRAAPRFRGPGVRPGSEHSARSSAPPPHPWLRRQERARSRRRQFPGRRARTPTHSVPWPCLEPPSSQLPRPPRLAEMRVRRSASERAGQPAGEGTGRANGRGRGARRNFLPHLAPLPGARGFRVPRGRPVEGKRLGYSFWSPTATA